MERTFCRVNGEVVEIKLDEEFLRVEGACQPCAHFAPFLDRLGDLLLQMIEQEPGRLRAERGVVWTLHYERLAEPVYAILNGVDFADVATNRAYFEYHILDQAFCFFQATPALEHQCGPNSGSGRPRS